MGKHFKILRAKNIFIEEHFDNTFDMKVMVSDRLGTNTMVTYHQTPFIFQNMAKFRWFFCALAQIWYHVVSLSPNYGGFV
jgi:hypothetical protein